MSNIEIKLIPTVDSDIDEVVQLCRVVAKYNPDSHWSEYYPNREILTRDISSGSLYKVLDQNKIISIMSIRSFDDYVDNDEERKIWSKDLVNPCGFGRFCIAPNYQGQGLGRPIIQALIQKASSLGYGSAIFYATKVNSVATHIYDAMGFERVGEAHMYDEDFICYQIRF